MSTGQDYLYTLIWDELRSDKVGNLGAIGSLVITTNREHWWNPEDTNQNVSLVIIRHRFGRVIQTICEVKWKGTEPKRQKT